jgi:hypothetical protein
VVISIAGPAFTNGLISMEKLKISEWRSHNVQYANQKFQSLLLFRSMAAAKLHNLPMAMLNN